MKTVYLLQSVRIPARHYVGMTGDLVRRLAEHNSGNVICTSRYRPWKVRVSILFEDDQRAAEFERYLKSGSGQAFAQRHLW